MVAAQRFELYRTRLSELKSVVSTEWWQKGICIAATYPAELWAGELGVSDTVDKLRYSFLNFTGYYAAVPTAG